MSKHKIVTKLGMSRDRLLFIWRHFHTYVSEGDYDSDNALCGEDNTAEEETLVEQTLEHVQCKEELDE